MGALDAASRRRAIEAATSGDLDGGLRYLEMGDLGLVREALRERELLLTRLAPHLVAPVPFLWPLRGRGWERAYLGAGLILYDTLVGAVQFHDAAEDDARMVVAVARTAAAHGAHVATRMRVTGFAGPGRVEAVDEETGEPLLLRARHVAGAAGVWTDRLRELAGGTSTRRIVPSKGVHIFVARERLRMDTGILARTEKSVLFVIPWQGGWLIGDTDTPWRHGPDAPVATGADVDYLLVPSRRVGRPDRPRLHRRRRAPPRGRARAPHPPRAHQRRPRARRRRPRGAPDGRRAGLGSRACARRSTRGTSAWPRPARARPSATTTRRSGPTARPWRSLARRPRGDRAARLGRGLRVRLVAGLDLGTSSTRCVVLDGDRAAERERWAEARDLVATRQ